MVKFLKASFKHFIIWTLAIAFWSLMRQFGQELVSEPELNTFSEWFIVHLTLGSISGLIFGTIEFFLDHSNIQRYYFGLIVFINSCINLVVFIFLICIGVVSFNYIQNVASDWEDVSQFLLSKESLLLIGYCYMVTFVASFVKQLDRKFGPGNLYKILIGKFHQPKEVERVFMFLDLNSSTTIAEKIGHFKYSRLIKDCFYDLRIVEKHRAEIYQYVGDEAVLTWKKKHAVSNSNCIAAFYAFKDKILSRQEYYKKHYGLVPSFKGGLNFGKTIVVEVGEIKREIAYHGDTINVASRIQGYCKEVGEELLISQSLRDILSQNNHYNIRFVENALLKGKQESINVFAVEREKTD